MRALCASSRLLAAAIMFYVLLIPSLVASPATTAKNVELLRSEQKLVEGKMKVTADVRVKASGYATLLVTGYDATGRIIELKKDDKFIYIGRTEMFQLTLDNGERLKKIDVQVLDPISTPYQLLATATVAHKDYYEAIIVVKNGDKAQAINAVSKGINAKGELVEISGESLYVYEQRSAQFTIKMEATTEIDHIQVIVLADDETYLVDSGLYVKDGIPIFTAVVKNGSKAQTIKARVTPITAENKALPDLTSSAAAGSNRLYMLRLPLTADNSTVGKLNAIAAFYPENGKEEIRKRGILVTLNGKGLSTKQQPLLVASQVVVPMRAIFEELGAQLNWDPRHQTITATKGSKEIKLQLGSADALINGSKVVLAVKPQILNNTTMVPVRFVSEALGADVIWDGPSRTVIISQS